MAKLAEIIGLSYADLVDITAWALYLIIFGVAMGKGLYDFLGWFGETIISMFARLLSFVARHFRTFGK